MIKKPENKKTEQTKPLSPCLRTKTRYVVFELLNPKKVDSMKIISEIETQCRELFGLIGFADMDFRKIQFDKKSNKGIIMINRKSVDKLKLSFTFLNNKKNLGIVSRYVSGSLKKAKSFI